MSDAKRARLQLLPVVLCAFTTAALFLLPNYFGHHPRCYDCQQPLGLPFAFWQPEGFADSPRVLWGGLVADLTCIFVLTVAFAVICSRIASAR
jgi:hypothetical protein